MTHPHSAAGDPASKPGWFSTTHWSVVLAARDVQAPAAREALEKLCGAYWFPLYAYARRRGCAPADAEDLTQGFFARLIERNGLRNLRPGHGRFRHYLLVAFRNFVADEWDRAQAQKRGGLCRFIPLDRDVAERRVTHQLPDEFTPERAYERAWALMVLERVRSRLIEECTAAGREHRFELIEHCLPGVPGDLSQAEVGRRLGLSESAVRSEVHRLKRRYGELLRLEIAHTVADSAEIEPEIHHLIEMLSE